jgi:LuxR family maltose regulon positive regulatory protein
MTPTAGGLVISDDCGDFGLFDDKLEIPDLGPTILRRPRIDELMGQATRHRVTIVTGPAGAGKTIACAGWAAAGLPGRRVAWLTADAGDRDPARFWQYMITALARAGAVTAEDADQLSARVLTPRGLPQQVIACIAAPDSQAALVVDDVHELAGSGVLADLDELVHHAPPGLRLVLAGRHVPGLTLAKLRLSGQLGEVGPADLACTGQEAETFLASVGAVPAPELRTAIMKQSEGWMAGLRLLSMSLRPSATGGSDPDLGPEREVAPGLARDEARGPERDVARSVDSELGAAPEFIGDYICDEILAPLGPETREFLLRTCLTDVVPPDLAQVLTGDSSAAARLEQLSRENGLIRPIGPTHADYRYHPMLRNVLEAVLRREHPEEVPTLLSLVARWQAGRGEPMAALRAAAQAGDWDFGRQVIAAASPFGPPDGGWAELEEVLSSFPPGCRSNDAVLACALAAARLWQGDPDGALPYLDCAQSALGGDPSPAGPGQTAGRLWLAALQVMRLAGTGADLSAQWSLASHAHEKSRSVPEHRGTGLLWLALGCASLRQLEVQQARSALRHAGSQLAAGGLAAERERARSWEAVALAWHGDLAAATRIAAEVAEELADSARDLAPILAVSQAQAHVARDEPEAAALLLDQSDQAIAAVQPAGEPVIGVLSGMIRTRIAIDEGNSAGARGLVRLLTETASGERGPDAAIAVLDAEISLLAGEPERARATLSELAGLSGLSGPTGPAERAAGVVATSPEAAVCQARLLMVDDDDKGALKVLEPMIGGPAVISGPARIGAQASADPLASGLAGTRVLPVTGRLSALLTAVIAHRRLNQASEAAELLEEALALAEPDDQSGPFITAGPPIRSALTVLITSASRCAAFAGRILDRFDGRLPHGASPPSGTPLTESELAVLRFLPSHMTNQEIAESLFLSINTIKTHLSSVYRKLGVTSRRQAIAQGRRLDLL